jgi:hypothetical protein
MLDPTSFIIMRSCTEAKLPSSESLTAGAGIELFELFASEAATRAVSLGLPTGFLFCLFLFLCWLDLTKGVLVSRRLRVIS